MGIDLSGIIQEDSDGVRLRVRVTPRAAKSALAGVADSVLRVRIAAPPVDGKANEALLRYLSELFAVPVRRVAIVHGESGREKTVKITGLKREEALQALRRALAPS